MLIIFQVDQKQPLFYWEASRGGKIAHFFGIKLTQRQSDWKASRVTRAETALKRNIYDRILYRQIVAKQTVQESVHNARSLGFHFNVIFKG
jgi:hypothetical protein